MWDLITEWNKEIAAVAAAVYFGFPYLKKIKIPKIFTGSASTDSDLETEDQRCINHLRDRAIEYNATGLLKDIKVIDAKFFDIHSGLNNVPTNESNITK